VESSEWPRWDSNLDSLLHCRIGLTLD
jgi:hypothetical protein